MLKPLIALLLIVAAVNLCLSSIAARSPRPTHDNTPAVAATTPQEVVSRFCRVYLRHVQGLGYILRGKARRDLAPFLSERLLGILDDARACQEDWIRQQPKDSTDKPPFVDCCLFACTAELPTSFSVGGSRKLPDGRYRVSVTYIRKETPGTYLDRTIPLHTITWGDAFIVMVHGRGYKIDDFVFIGSPITIDGRAQRDLSRNQESLLSQAFLPDCRAGRWIGGK